MIEYDPQFGSSINKACADACEIAGSHGETVCFTFNGTAVTVSPGEAAEVVISRWEASREAAARAYRRTPEYAEQQRQDKLRQVRLQGRMRQCMRRLPRAVRGGEQSIVEWLAKFVLLNDWTFTHCDRSRVKHELMASGYSPGDCVGHPDVQTDPHVMARWIVGQVLDGLVYHHGTIHPMMSKFAKEYGQFADGLAPRLSRATL